MMELRKEKKKLKKSRKALHKQGLKGSACDKNNTRRWFQVMKEHAKLRKLLANRSQSKNNAHQLRRFKANPMKFGKSLFEKKVNGDPAFSSGEFYDYFSNLYCDPTRGESATSMPSMTPVEKPFHLLSEAAPSIKEIRAAVRKKSNGAAPGLDCISYVPCKCCP